MLPSSGHTLQTSPGKSDNCPLMTATSTVQGPGNIGLSLVWESRPPVSGLIFDSCSSAREFRHGESSTPGRKHPRDIPLSGTDAAGSVGRVIQPEYSTERHGYQQILRTPMGPSRCKNYQGPLQDPSSSGRVNLHAGTRQGHHDGSCGPPWPHLPVPALKPPCLSVREAGGSVFFPSPSWRRSLRPYGDGRKSVSAM